MLKQLYIKNFTLIDELNISLYPGFSVITGETGAGKSIILGAIGLLLGNRADSKAIKAGRDRCVIEAHFDLSRYGMQKFFDDNDIDYDADDTIIRRELTAAGKSRAFINDTPVPLTQYERIGRTTRGYPFAASESPAAERRLPAECGGYHRSGCRPAQGLPKGVPCTIAKPRNFWKS